MTWMCTMKSWNCPATVVLLLLLLEMCGATPEKDSRPNILLIMVDDLGIGDLGCYGNDTVRTPNINRLAREGVKLTQNIAAESLCTPSRSAFLTGRYPVRTGMAFQGIERRCSVYTSLGFSGGLPRNETTFASILKKEGYRTGLIGKWHQGLNCKSRSDHCHHPEMYGFDFYYGMPHTLSPPCWPDPSRDTELSINYKLWMCLQLVAIVVLTLVLGKLSGWFSVPWSLIIAMTLFIVLLSYAWFSSLTTDLYWDCLMMRGHEITEQPMKAERAGSIMVQEAVSFIEKNRLHPFLLFFSFLHVHVPLPTTDKFMGISKHGLYGDNVEEMDFMVGTILNAIDANGLKNNTLVYFASDHGGHLEARRGHTQLGGWNGIYKGGKGMSGWEGGIRVPGIIRWPQMLQAGKVIDEPTSLMDVLPTLASLVGVPLPSDRVIDGRDLMPLLQGKVQHSEHEFLFHYCGSYLHAIRWRETGSARVWKVHYMTPVFSPQGAIGCYDILFCQCTGENVTRHSPPLVFDLSRDPSESTPLSPDTEPLYNLVINSVEEALAEHRQTLTPVPPQMPDCRLDNVWLRPCCGVFPFCLCDHEKKDAGLRN